MTKELDPAAIRNIALIGHPNSGKTTLAEALLHRTGAVKRAGSITEGSTALDHEPEEIARGISVTMGLATIDWTVDGTTYEITILDAPGYADFAGSVDAALTVADLAVIVVSAMDGVQAGTEYAWRTAHEAGVPCMVVVTKEDRPRADFRAVLADLRETFGDVFVPLELPIGEEEDLHGVVDVLGSEGLAYGDDGSHRTEALDGALESEEKTLHDEVVEEIVTHDDEQMERYLSGDEPCTEELVATLAAEVAAGEAVPVVLCSATTEVGVDRVADLICLLGPAPTARPAHVLLAADGAEPTDIEVVADPAGDTLVHIFRSVADPFGQISVFKVLSGTLKAGDHLTDTATGQVERLGGLFRLRGHEHDQVDQVGAGQIAAVAKLTSGLAGTMLSSTSYPVRALPLPDRPAVYRMALVPESQSDDDKLSSVLARLTAEDPTLRADLAGAQAVLSGLGDTHLAVALERAARLFGVHVTTEPVKVPYRETIKGAADVEGKLKKQSGGHGQFAVVQLRVTPLPRGAGFEFVDSVVGGSVPRNYIPAVERGIQEAMAAGGPQGHPVVDVRVELYDGKSHPVDSSDMAFRTAAGLGLREAFAKAGTVVLEPTLAVAVTVPVDAQGDVMGDLSTRRGRITSTSSIDDRRALVEAVVPQAEMINYVLNLRSMTGGRGSFTVRPEGYEVATAPVPAGA